ncbi:MAG: 50S ribosomal protein L18 [Elusimicrobiota bacterium]
MRDQKLIRKMRVRRKIHGTHERPRLSVTATLGHTYAQLVDDDQGRTLVFVSSRSPEFAKSLSHGDNLTAGKAVGQLLAKKALDCGVKTAVFDRGCRRFHGRVKALAEAVREGGVKI